MNEELKIVIKAVTDGAKKSISEVKKELEQVKEEGKKAGVTVEEALSKLAKGAAVAIGAVAALTAAIAKLGKSAQEINKGFSKLKNSFETSGASAKQATKYYKELFGVLGEHDRTVETGQSLARVTTDPAALGDYKNIMAGAMSQYGDGYNSEALAENIAETIAAAQVTGDLERVLIEAGISADGFNAALQQATSTEERELLVRSTLNGVLGAAGKAYIAANQATIAYNESQANLNISLASAAAYTTPLLIALNNLGASLLNVLSPALQVVSTYLTAFIQLMAEAIQWVGSFFGIFNSSSEKATADVAGYRAAMNDYLSSLRKAFGGTNSELDDTKDKINAVKKATMGFDELNIVSNPASTSSIGGGGSGSTGALGNLPEAPNPEDYGIGGDMGIDNITKDIENAKSKIKGLLTLIGIVGGAFAAWKIGKFVADLVDSYKVVKGLGDIDLDANWNSLSKEEAESVTHLNKWKDTGKKVGGYALIIAGAMLAVKGYSEAWVNGIDWGNFAILIAGIGAVVGGLALAIGPTAAAFGLVVGGIALVVLGVKDLIENGYSMEAVIAVAVGAIAILVGAIWAFNGALLASPITWIVVGIMAVVAVFVILWNECDAFRNFWLQLWEEAKKLFAKFVDSIQPVIDALVFAFEEAWELIKVIWFDYLVPMFKEAWELIKVIWDAVKPYFQFIWDSIKAIFSIVSEVIGGFFKAAWEVVKAVWNVAVGYFKTVIENIGLVFGVIKDLLSGNFSAAWEKIKKIFSNVGDFFKGVIDTIVGAFKNIAGIVGETISNVVGKAINVVLNTAITIINGFIKTINGAIGIINKIPGVEIKKLKLLDVPQLATGGIVTADTLARIGEGGKREAVLPLEQNTEWMDTLADKIAARNGAPSKIVLMLDGKELGWASINSINDITRQTGTLQLNVI